MANNQPHSVAGAETAIRRVTGSANIPLSPAGRNQARAMSANITQPFDYVFCAPEERSIETAQHFGDPIVLEGLDAWYRGQYEGLPASDATAAMRSLILHPDRKAPGKSPISGKPGESYDEFLGPLLLVMRTADEHLKDGERILLVTSGGNLQAIDHFAKVGFAGAPSKADYTELAQRPYWSATGKLFRVAKQGLQPVSDNTAPGLYAIEHGATGFNPTEGKSIPQREPAERNFSSVRFDLPPDSADAIRAFAAKLPRESLAPDGIEKHPHVTVLSGIHSDSSQETIKALRGKKAPSARLKHLSLFANPEHDVLKLDVQSPDLHHINSHLKDNLQHTETYPSYKPHVTVAYLKPGHGKKYTGRIIPGVTLKKLRFSRAAFSPGSGEPTTIPLS